MRAAILTGYGDADKLRVRIVPRPTPAAGQVLVRVHATTVNDYDWSMVIGRTSDWHGTCFLDKVSLIRGKEL